MTLCATDTVRWTRKTIGGTVTSLGHPVESTAAGWPKTVKGSWQGDGKTSVKNPEGRSIRVDARLYSETFHDGLVNDYATFGGNTYRCVGSDTQTKLSSSDPEYTEYVLVFHKAGVDDE